MSHIIEELSKTFHVHSWKDSRWLLNRKSYKMIESTDFPGLGCYTVEVTAVPDGKQHPAAGHAA